MMIKCFLVLLAGTIMTSVVQAIDPSKAQWYGDVVFNPYGPSKDPEGKKKYASFFAEDAVLCYPDGFGECFHGRAAIEQRSSLPFVKAQCDAIRPLTNDSRNAISYDWVCALDYGNGCLGSHHGRGYIEFDEHDKIKMFIGFAHPDDPSVPACYIDKKQDL